MILKIDEELCTGCNECHEHLQRRAGNGFKALKIPELPEIAFGSGCLISEKNAEQFHMQIQLAFEKCPEQAISLEES